MTESLHVVCPACLAKNRVPAGRVRQSPKCGGCHEQLFAGKPVALTQHSFHQWLRGTDIPIVVDFWAPWCGPCLSMAPAFEQAARELEPDVLLAKLDTQSEPAIGNELGIRSIPTLVLFKRGREVLRHSGAIGSKEIVRWARSALAG
ncbi:MAG: thioredoxin TrxC [Gammaproteobacteria bacterium]